MRLYQVIFLLAFTLGLVFNSYSDSGCGSLPPCYGYSDDDPGVNCCNEDITVPFDGGVSLLIAAGLGVGVSRIYKKKKVTE